MNDMKEPPLSTRVPMVMRELRDYLGDTWPIDRDRYWDRENFEGLVRNFQGKLQRNENVNPDEIDPTFNKTFLAFINQTMEFNAAHHKAEAEKRVADRHAEEIETERRAAEQRRKTAEVESFERGRKTGWNEERERAAVYAEMFKAGHGIPNEEKAPARTPSTPAPVLSAALEAYYAERLAADGSRTAREGAPILEYLVHFFADCVATDLTGARLLDFYQHLPEVPHTKGIPGARGKGLAARVAYANEHGWEGLTRMAEGTIVDNWRSHLKSFSEFLLRQGWLDRIPVFALTKVQRRELMTKLPKDRATKEELMTLLGAPLFTGCKNAAHIWTPGDYFVQDYVYWAYLILLTTGMRTGEPASIRLSDIKEIDGNWYFDMMPFDPSKGRVANKDLRHGKSAAAARQLPIHPLLIFLGLLERKRELEAIGATLLFPEWQPYVKKGSLRVQWSRPITRSFQYFKEKFGIDRPNLTTYWTRRHYAYVLDRAGLPERTRNMLMGHATKKVSDIYGGHQGLADLHIEAIAAFEEPTFTEGARLLLEAKAKADAGLLTVIKPHLTRANWVDRSSFEDMLNDFGED